MTAAAGLAVTTAPDVAHYLPFLEPLLRSDPLITGIATVLAPSVAAILFVTLAVFLVRCELHILMSLPVIYYPTGIANMQGSISISGGQLFVFKVTFFIVILLAAVLLIAAGALLFALHAFDVQAEIPKSIANGSIYMSILALSIVVNVAIISPAFLLLQPLRLWHVLRAEHQALTPRQRFRGRCLASPSESCSTEARFSCLSTYL